MRGMNAATGRALEGDAHLRQSIADILTTPLGSRVMRRDYGSLLFELVDQPWNALTRLRLYAAVALALSRWETRLRLRRVSVERDPETGAIGFQLEADRTDVPTPNARTRLTVPLRQVSGGGALIPVL